MTSITGARPHLAAGLVRTPGFAIPARLRMTAAVAAAVVGRSFAAARAYEAAHSTSGRRAALREFAGAR